MKLLIKMPTTVRQGLSETKTTNPCILCIMYLSHFIKNMYAWHEWRKALFINALTFTTQIPKPFFLLCVYNSLFLLRKGTWCPLLPQHWRLCVSRQSPIQVRKPLCYLAGHFHILQFKEDKFCSVFAGYSSYICRKIFFFLSFISLYYGVYRR